MTQDNTDSIHLRIIKSIALIFVVFIVSYCFLHLSFAIFRYFENGKIMKWTTIIANIFNPISIILGSYFILPSVIFQTIAMRVLYKRKNILLFSVLILAITTIITPLLVAGIEYFTSIRWFFDFLPIFVTLTIERLLLENVNIGKKESHQKSFEAD